MDSKQCIWSELPTAAGIATLVCYAGVFEDVIGVGELASRLGNPDNGEFNAALSELQRQGKIVVRGGFASLPDLADRIDRKAEKMEAAKRLVSSRLRSIQKMAGSSMIKFVGISGSIAAGNPTNDRNNRLDIDLFLITRSQCLWRYNVLRALQNALSRDRDKPELCVNYIMDEDSLLVRNRNLYTATEIHNVIPIYGVETYRQFLRVNAWANYYYPGGADESAPVAGSPSDSLVNKTFFILYAVLRSIKWRDLSAVRHLFSRSSPQLGNGWRLYSSYGGGYQALIISRFGSLAKVWFPTLLRDELMEKLFPDQLSAGIRRGDIDIGRVVDDNGLERRCSKYGWQYILSKSG